MWALGSIQSPLFMARLAGHPRILTPSLKYVDARHKAGHDNNAAIS